MAYREEAGPDLDDAYQAFEAYFRLYDSERMHSSLGNQSPDMLLENHRLQPGP